MKEPNYTLNPSYQNDFWNALELTVYITMPFKYRRHIILLRQDLHNNDPDKQPCHACISSQGPVPKHNQHKTIGLLGTVPGSEVPRGASLPADFNISAGLVKKTGQALILHSKSCHCQREIWKH